MRRKFLSRLVSATVLTLFCGSLCDGAVRNDFDGDGKTDATVFRASTYEWFVFPSSGQCPPGMSQSGPGCYAQWGVAGDKPVTGDYDGDGKTDLIVFRPSTAQWFIKFAGPGGFASVSNFGAADGAPVACDFWNEGKVALGYASRAQSAIKLRRTSNGAVQTFALTGNQGTAGNSLLIFTPFSIGGVGSYATVTKTSVGVITWEIRVPGTMSPDNAGLNWPQSDLPLAMFNVKNNNQVTRVMFRPNETFPNWREFVGAAILTQWGLANDKPLTGDFDGDGKEDYGVWRPNSPYAGQGTFYVKTSSGNAPPGFFPTSGGFYLLWGLTGDEPLGPLGHTF